MWSEPECFAKKAAKFLSCYLGEKLGKYLGRLLLYHSRLVSYCNQRLYESYHNYVFDQYSHPLEKINLHQERKLERKIVVEKGKCDTFLQTKCGKGKVKAGEMRIG